MSCYNPLHAFIYSFKNDEKKIVSFYPLNEENLKKKPFKYRYHTFDEIVKVEETDIPCGSCVGCSLDYSLNWRNRMILEAAISGPCCFLTLTYDDDHLPVNGQVSKEHVQLFIKRLRKWCQTHDRPSPRYFVAAEYGSTTYRPHYHLILFNFSLEGLDFKIESPSQLNNPLKSYFLFTQLWPFGFNSVGEACPKTFAYVARYCVKKKSLDPVSRKKIKDSGFQTEFCLMSKGLGYGFIEKNLDHILDNDGIVYLSGVKIDCKKFFYDYVKNRNEDSDKILFPVKDLRNKKALAFNFNLKYSGKTLDDLLELKKESLKKLKRSL